MSKLLFQRLAGFLFLIKYFFLIASTQTASSYGPPVFGALKHDFFANANLALSLDAANPDPDRYTSIRV
jgi:hypothetical protein